MIGNFSKIIHCFTTSNWRLNESFYYLRFKVIQNLVGRWEKSKKCKFVKLYDSDQGILGYEIENEVMRRKYRKRNSK